jgi:aldose 1-epimerase
MCIAMPTTGPAWIARRAKLKPDKNRAARLYDAAVAGTPFNFRKPQAVDRRINDNDEQLHLGRRYARNWVLNKFRSATLTLAALLTDPQNGRTVEIRTTQPGLQLYTCSFPDGKATGGGSVFKYRTALCLETQHFPDSPNKLGLPSTILRSGQTYSEKAVLAFRAAKQVGYVRDDKKPRYMRTLTQ